MIDVKNLSFRYHKNGPQILDNLSFAIEKGEVLAVLSFLNEERSLIIITNRELSGWINAAEDTHLMQTLVDRITANSQIIRL